MADSDYYRSRIQRALEYIDAHLQQRLSAEQVAKAAHFSEYHFHRIFPAYMGEPIHHYVRSRRLEKAATTLRQQPSYGVTRLALEVGFETPSAFAKAFKQHYGLSPSAFKSGQQPPSAQPLRSEHNRPYLKTKAAADLNLPMQIQQLPECLLQYRCAQGTKQGRFFAELDLAKLFDGLLAHKPMAAISAYPVSPQGLHDKSADVWYGGLFAIDSLASWSEQNYSFGAGTWAVFNYQGSYDYLHQAWSQVYCVWLSNSHYKLRDDLPFEMYLNSPQQVPAQQLQTQIWLPVTAPSQ